MSAPRPEIAHWLTATVMLFLGLVLLSEAIVGTTVFRRRAWRAYLFPVFAICGGVLLWLIAALSTFSTMHLLAHSLWAQAAMIAGGVQLAVVRGKLSRPAWSLVSAMALLLSGASFLIHEQNGWLFSRSAFLHHAIGWLLVAGALFPIGQAIRPRRPVWIAGFALTFVVMAVFLFADRDLAPVFGHLSQVEGSTTP
jgi:hypothetical protein